MDLATMIRMVNFNVDDVIDNQDIVDLLNRAKDRMAAEVGARFPDIELTGDLSDTFAFDEEYHELPVLYASAMVKAMDSSIVEKESFMSQFLDGLRLFAAKYTPPVQYWHRDNCEQFDAEEGQTVFVVTKPHYKPTKRRFISVYINGIPTDNFSYHGREFVLSDDIKEGDRITIVWEADSVYTNRPAYYVGW